MTALPRIPFVTRAHGAGASIIAGVASAAHWAIEQTRAVWKISRETPWPVLRARLLLGLIVVGISVFWGMATAVLEKNALYLAIGLMLSLFILIDFRVGVVTLILFLPFTQTTLFPHQLLGITGLNPLNLLLAATLLSYIVRHFWGAVRHPVIPREMWWLYILPLVIAAGIGATHVGDIPAFVRIELVPDFDDAPGYLRDLFIRPMFSVFFALLVAAAVVETQKLGGFLIAGIISLWVIMLTIFVFFLASGASLGEISGAGGESRSFFSPLGLHSNAVGRFFAIACGMLLFSLNSYKARLPRIVVWGSAIFALLATLITFSRGAYLLLLVMVLLYLKSLKSKHRVLTLALALPVILLALPSTVYNRFLFGLGTGADLNTLSSGRTDEIWQPLVPEIFNSPVMGHGLSSILWSDAMKSGSILVVGHPHNAFLKLVLDMGFLGGALILAYGWRVWKRFRQLSQEPLLAPELRGFFAGAAAALVGFTIAGISGSSFDPIFEQFFLWLAIGLMYGLGLKLELKQRAHG